MANVAIVYVSKEDTPFKEAISESFICDLASMLSAKGHIQGIFKFSPSSEFLKHISMFRPDVVLNLAYGYEMDGIRIDQAAIANSLEKINCRLIGSNSSALSLVQDKVRCSEILRSQGVRVARSIIMGDDLPPTWKCIIKPRFGGCHRDIRISEYSQLSEDDFDLSKYIVEDYISGREFTIGLYESDAGLTAFKPLEIEFAASEKIRILGDHHPAVSYAHLDRDEFHLRDTAKSAFSILSLSDYSRMDFRVNDDNEAFLIDVNGLPNLDPERSFLPMIALENGVAIQDLMISIIDHKLSSVL